VRNVFGVLIDGMSDGARNVDVTSYLQGATMMGKGPEMVYSTPRIGSRMWICLISMRQMHSWVYGSARRWKEKRITGAIVC
jgi:hypothetical protein